MNLLKPLLSLILILGAHAVFSQKDAPVAGDAITLVDLLNKDYNTVGPDQRMEELSRDRAKVIGILKSYLSQGKNGVFLEAAQTLDTDGKISESISKAYNNYIEKSNNPDKTESAQQRRPIGFVQAEKAKDESLTTLFQAYHHALYMRDSSQIKALANSFDENPYMKHIAELFDAKYQNLSTNRLDEQTAATAQLTAQKTLPFIGGDLSFTTAIDGLSRFLATRIKEELTTYVIDKVKEWLENPSDESGLNELKVLLPRTVEYLLQFRADQMLNFGDEMKQYIEEDLNNVLENLPNLRNTPRFERLLEMHPDMDFAFEALELIPQLANMKRPIEYFEILENSRTLGGWDASDNSLKQNIYNSVKLTCLIARSMTTKESGQLEIIDLEQMNHYLDNTEFYMLYYGMLHQQDLKYYGVKFKIASKKGVTMKTITAQGTSIQTFTQDKEEKIYVPLSSMMKEVMSTFNKAEIDQLETAKSVFESMLSQLGLSADHVNATALELRKLNKKGEKIPVELAHTFVAGIVDLSDEVALMGDSLINFLMSELAEIHKVLDTIIVDTRGETPTYSAVFTVAKGEKPERFPLYEKVSPYISAARATNDIILDLHNENYAMVFLKALEIATTMLPDNVLTEVTAAVDGVSELKRKINGEDVALLVSVRSGDIKKGAKFEKLNKNFEDQAIKLNQALIKWMFFFRGNYPANPELEKDVAAVKAVLAKIISGTNSEITESDITAFTKLASNDTFKKLIVAYYSNQELDKLSQRLSAELEQFKITIKGSEVPLFSASEAKEFKKLFDSYTAGTIDWVLASKKDKKGEEEKLIGLESELKSFLEGYAFAFPSKLSIDPNSQVFRLIHFVNDMAKSKDAEDVEKAIEAFALPSGSYAIKRTARFNASVNAYPGILLGTELTRTEGKVNAAMSASLTVPVGLSLAWGTEKCGSFGVFAPVIDIGAFTRVHLDSDTNTFALPEINFGNIFSPGLYFSYGFPKSPVSINLGGQYGPELRRVEANGEIKSYESWRVGVGVVLDIPLFNLYTRPRINYN